MSSWISPFYSAEVDYRRQRIAADFDRARRAHECSRASRVLGLGRVAARARTAGVRAGLPQPR